MHRLFARTPLSSWSRAVQLVWVKEPDRAIPGQPWHVVILATAWLSPVKSAELPTQFGQHLNRAGMAAGREQQQ
jgi:hypothetical protein